MNETTLRFANPLQYARPRDRKVGGRGHDRIVAILGHLLGRLRLLSGPPSNAVVRSRVLAHHVGDPALDYAPAKHLNRVMRYQDKLAFERTEEFADMLCLAPRDRERFLLEAHAARSTDLIVDALLASGALPADPVDGWQPPVEPAMVPT